MLMLHFTKHSKEEEEIKKFFYVCAVLLPCEIDFPSAAAAAFHFHKISTSNTIGNWNTYLSHTGFMETVDLF